MAEISFFFYYLSPEHIKYSCTPILGPSCDYSWKIMTKFGDVDYYHQAAYKIKLIRSMRNKNNFQIFHSIVFYDCLKLLFFVSSFTSTVWSWFFLESLMIAFSKFSKIFPDYFMWRLKIFECWSMGALDILHLSPILI